MKFSLQESLILKNFPDYQCQFPWAGLDEVGYGAWAGPIVVGCVTLSPQVPDGFLAHVKDSKQLSAAKREILFEKFDANPLWGSWKVAVVSVEVLHEGNPLWETRKAMLHLAIEFFNTLNVRHFLLDGRYPLLQENAPPTLQSQGIVAGDQKSDGIALASIMAKVYRDRIMEKDSQQFPFYQWHKNKGYGTRHHQMAIENYGLSPNHRKKYCQKFLEKLEKEKNLIFPQNYD